MNYFIVLRLLGLLLATVGALMLPSLAWSLYGGDGAQGALLQAMLVTAGVGGAMYLVGRTRRQDLFRKEATAVVGLGWLLCALAGALPFYFADAFPSYIDCFFECMSGFTTTGASVLTDFDALPRSLHFWRCFTHWLGGMGIIVLFVALLPFLGAGGRALLKREVPGPVSETFTPRVKDTAILLWKIYFGLTVAETIVLMLCGMSFFDALCHTFATLATGGFSTHPNSIAGYGSLAVELTIVVFMIAAGTNFALYYGVLRGDRRVFLRDREWRGYVALLGVSILFVAVALARSGLGLSIAQSLRQATFQVVSIMTTTGFATADFDTWPTPVKVWLVLLMFVGGSAGSTGGGIKVVRWIVLAKVAWGHLERIYSPHTVRKLRLGNAVLNSELATSTLVFFFIWTLVFCLGTFLVALTEGARVDLVTAATSVAATLNNIGPGLGLVGATENYASMRPVTKLLLAFFMVLGRLELYTVLVLFVPRFWRAK